MCFAFRVSAMFRIKEPMIWSYYHTQIEQEMSEEPSGFEITTLLIN